MLEMVGNVKVERLEPWLFGGIQPVKNGSSQPANAAGQEEPSADRLEISPLARELQLYRARLEELRDVRQEKVAEIRRQLAEGSYRIDARKIAAAMLEERRLDRRA